MEKEIAYGYESKRERKIPKGAEILNKSSNIRVKEIENGFLICKSIEIEYMVDDRRDWMHTEKQWYSKENPLKVDKQTQKYLADNF